MKTAGIPVMAVAVLAVAGAAYLLSEDASALVKGQGVFARQTGSDSPVCGDRLCSEVADERFAPATPSDPPPAVPDDGKADAVDGAEKEGGGDADVSPLMSGACPEHEGKTRTYYVAADEVVWDYAPSGMNLLKNHAFDDDENVFMGSTDSFIGSMYLKAVYREYTDATFSELKPRTAEWEHLGVLGPVLHAEVCDTLEVVFKNNAGVPYSMHPHGVFYDKDSEGASYADGTSGTDKLDDAVQPGQMHTYVWPVPERAGPGPADPSSITWMYHSHVDSPADTNSGLVGPIIVTARGMADADGRPADVDREFVTMFTVFDENSGNYLCENLKRFTGETCDNADHVEDDGFVESNLMHGINGYLYGNLRGLDMNRGENVRWYLIGMGTEVDIHTPHWHGNTVLLNGNRADVVDLMPASLRVVDMVPDNPGTWMYHCHVNDHILAGMSSVFTVE